MPDLDKIIVELSMKGVREMDTRDEIQFNNLLCKKLREAGIPVKTRPYFTPTETLEVFAGVEYGLIEAYDEKATGSRIITWHRNRIIH